MNLFIFALLLLGIALSLPAALVPILKKINLVDIPNHRSSHNTITLRGGGIAVAFSIVVGLIANMLISNFEWSATVISATVLVGVILTSTLGVVEDHRGISVKYRIVFQLSISLLVALLFLHFSGQHLLWSVPLAFVGMFCINTANFMDGINGISSFHGVLLGLTAVVSGILASSAELAILGAVIAISFLGFLPWNFPLAKMFLGDSGSYLLGGLFFSVGYWIFAETGSLLLAIAPVVYYAFDVTFTLLVRRSRDENLTEAHRDHLYQQLQRRSASHVKSSFTIAGLTAAIVTTAVLTYQGWILVSVSLSLVLALLTLSGLTFQDRRTRSDDLLDVVG